MKTATKALLTAFLTLSLISNAATLEIVEAGNPEDITIGNETLQTVHDIEVEAPNSTEAHLYYSIGSLREAEIDLDSVSGPSAEKVNVDGANFSSSNFNSNSGNHVLELVFTDTEDAFRVENFTYGSLGTDGASEETGLRFYAAADNETNSSLSGSNSAPDSSNKGTSNYSVTSDSTDTGSGDNNPDNETENTENAEISLEAGFVKPAEVEQGKSISNQLFNVKAHNLSLDGNTDTVTFLFPDRLTENNTLSDQANQIISNISVSGSIRSVDPDSDSIYEGLRADLQEDGQGVTTANITLDSSMNYPKSDTAFEIEVMINDSKTGEDLTSLGTIEVGQETESEQQETEEPEQEETEETGQEEKDGTEEQMDSVVPEDTDTSKEQVSENASADTARPETDREPDNTRQIQGLETPRATEYRPLEGETLAIFGQISKRDKAKVELGRDRQIESIKIDPKGAPETLEIRIENTELNGVEGQEVYAARNIETDHEIESANITFRVNRTWIESHRNDVVMKRLEEGNWNTLEPTELERTNDSVVYRAETPGFSKFAVTTSTTTETYSTALTGRATEGRPRSVLTALIIGLLALTAVFYYKKREGQSSL